MSPVLRADLNVLPPRYLQGEDSVTKSRRHRCAYEVVAMEALLVELLEGGFDEELA